MDAYNGMVYALSPHFYRTLYNRAPMKKSFYIYALGCPKNSVDSQSMAELLHKHGYAFAADRHAADVIIVNTCGFIEPARTEALDLLKEIASEKRTSQYLIAAGCLTQRESELVARQVPGVDAMLGTRRWMDILPVVKKLEDSAQKDIRFINTSPLIMEAEDIPRVVQYGGYAYLKIADGCDRRCAFCAIPNIKGPQVSRRMENILHDVNRLADLKIQELILIAQDVTSYGHDMGMKDGLPDLLMEIMKTAPHIPWVRLLYTYPGQISSRLIEMMAEQPRLLPYLDIPLQHAHPEVLRRMHRPANMHQVRDTIAEMRARIPNLAIRSTFIVGFPGESDTEFQSLLDFVDEMQFDRVGIFPYYHEKGTAAFRLKDNVSPELKEERLQQLAALQEDISEQKNRQFIGKEMKVIVDGVGEGMSICRSYRDAPEIDGMVMVEEELEVGKITAVEITAALVHDLVAKKI
jgi:ribosomal protein S12 methylthiotransferase